MLLLAVVLWFCVEASSLGLGGLAANMNAKSVLVVENEEDLRKLLSNSLAKEGYSVVEVTSGEKALAVVENAHPDLVLLDVVLPGMNGNVVCRKLKTESPTAKTPVIMMTSAGDRGNVVESLTIGADDYVTKPFSINELIARVQAVLHRFSSENRAGIDKAANTIALHELLIRLRRYEVLVAGNPIDLTFTEFRTLALLAGNPGIVHTRQEILEGVHGEKHGIMERAVDVQIFSLRKKLGIAGKYIETVQGVGYRFKD